MQAASKPTPDFAPVSDIFGAEARGEVGFLAFNDALLQIYKEKRREQDHPRIDCRDAKAKHE